MTGPAASQPRLADSWQWSPDRLTLRLKLHSGVLFHDGTPARRRDGRARLLQNVSTLQETPSYADVSSVEAATPHDGHPSEATERLPAGGSCRSPRSETTDRPDIATGPVPDRSVESRPVSSLPSTKYYRAGRGSTVSRSSRTTRCAAPGPAMMRGDIDVLQEVGRDTVEFVEAESSVQVYRFLRPYYFPLVFNVRHPILKSKRSPPGAQPGDRSADDRREGMHGRGRVGRRPDLAVPLGLFAKRSASTRTTRRRRGCGSKRRVSRCTAIRRPDGCRAGSAIHVPPGRRRTGVRPHRPVLQKQFAEIGVDMQIQPVPLKDFCERVRTGDFDAFLLELVSARSLTWTYSSGTPDGPVPPHRLHGCGRRRSTGCACADERRRDAHRRRRAAAGSSTTIRRRSSSRGRRRRARSDGKFDVAADANPDIMGTLWRWRPPPSGAGQRDETDHRRASSC